MNKYNQIYKSRIRDNHDIVNIINDYMKEKDSKFAWRISLYYYVVGFILMMMACWSKWKNSKENETIPSIRRKRDIIAKTGKYLNEFGSGDKVELIKVYKPKPARKHDFI